MNPIEIYDKAYEKFPVKMVPDDDTMGFTESDVNERSRVGYIEAYKEISALPTIKGWVARDTDNALLLFSSKPERFLIDDSWDRAEMTTLPGDLFPSLRWEDEPIEVELPIIRK